MADLTITAANVAMTTPPGSLKVGQAGATITAGQALYKDTTTTTYKLADNNGVGTDSVAGIAMGGAATGQPIVYNDTIGDNGSMNLGATLTVGEIYCLSDTPGGICPYGDIGAGEKLSIIGYAKTASQFILLLKNTGVTK